MGRLKAGSLLAGGLTLTGAAGVALADTPASGASSTARVTLAETATSRGSNDALSSTHRGDRS
jgi:hypothetical protein